MAPGLLPAGVMPSDASAVPRKPVSESPKEEYEIREDIDAPFSPGDHAFVVGFRKPTLVVVEGELTKSGGYPVRVNDKTKIVCSASNLRHAVRRIPVKQPEEPAPEDNGGESEGPAVAQEGSPPNGTTVDPMALAGTNDASVDVEPDAVSGRSKQELGTDLYQKVKELRPGLEGKITGMLLESDQSELETMMAADGFQELEGKIEACVEILVEFHKTKQAEAEAKGLHYDDPEAKLLDLDT